MVGCRFQVVNFLIINNNKSDTFHVIPALLLHHCSTPQLLGGASALTQHRFNVWLWVEASTIAPSLGFPLVC